MYRKIANFFGFSKKPKIGWLLLGDIKTGSSRIHGLNIHNYLLSQGVDSVICQLSSPANRNLLLSHEQQELLLSSGINILIFQKVFDDNAVIFAKVANERGIKTIFLQSDKLDTEMTNVVDQLVVSSEFLQNYYAHSCNAHAICIEDAIEVPEKLQKKHIDKKSLQIIWVGHSDNWATLGIVRDALKSLGDDTFSLKTISDHRDADVKWDLDTIFSEILTGDIAVIPTYCNDWGKSKSNNRLTMFMALGMPVIASPIPVYSKIITDGVNGFLADDQSQWSKHLLQMKDFKLRREFGSHARSDVLARYRMKIIGDKWLDVFEHLLRKRNT
jgi:glycosyltransferase involved in cell wall biosynthesis